LAVKLAAEILASPVIALAHEVLAGGPHAPRKRSSSWSAPSRNKARRSPFRRRAGSDSRPLSLAV